MNIKAKATIKLMEIQNFVLGLQKSSVTIFFLKFVLLNAFVYNFRKIKDISWKFHTVKAKML